MAKEKGQIPCRGLGWTDAQWAEYERSGHKQDPNPPEITVTGWTRLAGEPQKKK